MVMTFYRKNDLWDREDIDWVDPHETEEIVQYMGDDIIDRPFIGDIVVAKDKLLKVYKTIVNYNKKELQVIVEVIKD
jgi:hypothetical protein